MSMIDRLRPLDRTMRKWRHAIHAWPEIAFEETRTAALVAGALHDSGFDEVHEGIGETGVVGVLHGRDGPGGRMIGLRADMDCLAMQEENSFAHASARPGLMHGCGHDGHTAMLLGAASWLAGNRQRFSGTVIVIFQPAEEGRGGAAAMIGDGLFERWPVEQIFGLHNWPELPAGQIAVHSGPVMASVDEFSLTITGNGGHAAMPDLCIDPVVIAAQMISAFQTIPSRILSPLAGAVVSVTTINAGSAFNVIPDQAMMRGTVRAFDTADQDRIEAAMQRMAENIAAAGGALAALDYRRCFPATINDRDAAQLAGDVAADLLGDTNVHRTLRPSMAGEDFAHMLERVPGAYIWLGQGGGASGCMLHNPEYDFNDDVLVTGAAWWCRIVERVLAPENDPAGKDI